MHTAGMCVRVWKGGRGVWRVKGSLPQPWARRVAPMVLPRTSTPEWKAPPRPHPDRHELRRGGKMS